MEKSNYNKIQGFNIIPSNFYIVSSDEGVEKMKIHAQTQNKKQAYSLMYDFVKNDVLLYDKILFTYNIMKGDYILARVKDSNFFKKSIA